VTRASIVLVIHSLRRFRGVLIGLGLILAAFQFLLTQVAAYLARQSAFSLLSTLIPEFARTAAGPSALAFMSFSGIVGLGYFHPVVLAALISLMIAIATEPAAEVEARFVDLVLSRPLARADIIVRTIIVLIVAATGTLTLMIAGTWAGLTCCVPAEAERPSLVLLLTLATNLAAIALCWAGVALALAAGARRRAGAGAVAGALALGAYLLDYIGRVWEPASGISRLSPFHYFEPMALVLGAPLNVRHVTGLLAVALAGMVTGMVTFAKRDV
jgi:ABC-2 type transport system permease protein